MIDAVVDEVIRGMENAANMNIKAADDYMDAETGLLMSVINRASPSSSRQTYSLIHSENRRIWNTQGFMTVSWNGVCPYSSAERITVPNWDRETGIRQKRY